MMSILLQALETHIRNKLSLPEQRFGIRHDQKPPPDCGDEYISLYGVAATVDQPDLNTGVDLDWSVGFTITRRTRYNPYSDVARKEFLSDFASMDFLLWKLVGWTHQSFDLLDLANARVGITNYSGSAFIEPLRLQSLDAMPKPITEAWFQPEASFAAAVTPSNTYPYSGMIMEAVFTKCKRILTLTSLQAEVDIL